MLANHVDLVLMASAIAALTVELVVEWPSCCGQSPMSVPCYSEVAVQTNRILPPLRTSCHHPFMAIAAVCEHCRRLVRCIDLATDCYCIPK